MGKNKTKSDSKTKNHDESVGKVGSSTSDKVKKSPKLQPATEKLAAVIKSVGLPESAEGLTADKLSENQKHVLKKVCAQMYGHKHTERKTLPARSLESATAQLAERMKQQLAQRKMDKKKQKQKNTD